MFLRFFLFAAALLFVSCTDAERNNPDDPHGTNYRGSAAPQSSAAVPVSSAAVAPSSAAATSGGKGNGIASYATKQIGAQVWMAENLNYSVSGSKCGGSDGRLKDEDTGNCDTYGRLYNWATAMALPASCNSSTCASQISSRHRGICPGGWHIPSDADWNALMKFVSPGCSDNSSCANAGTLLKAASGWSSGGNGVDTLGFSALPGGYGISDGSFYFVGDYGGWWSASEYLSDIANGRSMRYDGEGVGYHLDGKSLLHSVRCLQD